MSLEDNSENNDHVPTHGIDQRSWTIRLISSERFNASMAVEYMHTIQDKPSLTFLGRRLFDLPQKDLDFFLPQLVYLYVTKVDAASVTHAFFEKRYKSDAQFTVLCLWLLDCFSLSDYNKYESHASVLKNLLSKQIHGGTLKIDDKLSTLSLDTLQQSNWIAGSIISDNSKKFLLNGSQSSECIVSNLTLLKNQQKFVDRLVHIGTKLKEVYLLSSKQEKTIALQMELRMLNTMFPMSVWIPFAFDNTIVNICIEESAVLNSKDKVPYVFIAEVIRHAPNVSQADCDVSSLPISTEQENYTSKRDCSKDRTYHDVADPSVAVFAESWSEKKNRIRQSSSFGGNEKWDLIPVIVKTGDDLSQEAFAQQLLFIFKDIWNEEGVPLYLCPYNIICVGPDAGLIEPILDTLSLHQIKRNLTNSFRDDGLTLAPVLKHYFQKNFGPISSETYANAQKNFIQSTAAYSLVSYFLQLKDRHNGNILLDMEGHLIHIDYGFFLSSSPRNLGFETAPFKLTTELIDVMGGIDSDMFLYYKSLLLRGLMAARKHHRRIVSMVEIMSEGSKMLCFRAGPETIRALEGRFHISSTDIQLQNLVETLVDCSRDSYTTRFYDSFQYYTNGIH